MPLKAIESSTAVIGNVHLVYDKFEADREIRRLKRALWLARAKIAHLEEKLFVYDMAVDGVTTEQLHNAEIMANKWYHIKRLCINKAEEYK